jgi:hypothetical protein
MFHTTVAVLAGDPIVEQGAIKWFWTGGEQ